ncbi:hypothetical protein [Moraxella oblonga]|uniref:hypothetical protein n=1 Tax=Moraxella oblonga TaxID=200413 RepID=UPI00082F369B|nr:hypothetical protein [Moraxella oblonga]
MKTTQSGKPIAPIHHTLQRCWLLWLIHRLIIYPVVVSVVGGGVWWLGMVWQGFAMLPALLFTKAIWQGNSPYALLWASMVMLMYLGAVGVFLLMRFYEQAHLAITGMLAVEFLVVLGINVLLFVLLKRLPPMHKRGT